MTFRNWRIWVKSLPLSQKWFVVLILLRPIIDVFYFLKEISPVLSPLYIAGILTPILIGISYISRRFPKKYPSLLIDANFTIWSALVIFNVVLLTMIETGFQLVGNILRYTSPILLYFYLRSFVKSRKELNGLLQTFYYSALIPAAFLCYEMAIAPINPELLSANRGGAARMQGAYADIMNYAIYAIGALIIKCYFFLSKSRLKQVRIKNRFNLALVMLFCLGGLLAIKQSSSWGVALSIGILFILFNLNSVKGKFAVILLMPVFLFAGQRVFTSKIEPLIEKEYEVIEGDADLDRSFNGRMSRWKKYFSIWAEMPISSNLVGTPLSGDKVSSVMVSGGMHSDYVRVLFFTGIIGLSTYLLFFVNIVKRVRFLKRPEIFLILAVSLTVLLFSVTTTPLLYIPLSYFMFPVFAYAALPKPILLGSNG